MDFKQLEKLATCAFIGLVIGITICNALAFYF